MTPIDNPLQILAELEKMRQEAKNGKGEMLDALINTFGRHLAELFMKDRTNDSQELIEMLLSQRNYISALQDYIEASNETMQIFLSQDTSKDKLHAALEGMNEINEFKTIKLISGGNNVSKTLSNSFKRQSHGLNDAVQMRISSFLNESEVLDDITTQRNTTGSVQINIAKLMDTKFSNDDIHKINDIILGTVNESLHFYGIMEETEDKIDAYLKYVEKKFAEKEQWLFGEISTGNVFFIYEDNMLLSTFLDELIDHFAASKRNASIDYINILHDLYGKVKDGTIDKILNMDLLSKKEYEEIKDNYDILLAYLATYNNFLLSFINQTKRDTDFQSVGKLVEQGQLYVQQEVIETKIEKIKNHKPSFMKRVDELYNKDVKVFGGIPTKEVGKPEHIELKRVIFDHLYGIIELLKTNNYIDDQAFFRDTEDENSQLIKKVRAFNKDLKKYIKTIDKSSINVGEDEKGFTYHYEYEQNELGMITGVSPLNMSVPGPVIGNSIQNIKRDISNTISMKADKKNFLNAYPGIENSLDGNMIVLGPYGVGKTALIRDLGYNKEYATIHVTLSEITGPYYGVLEKNTKLIFEKAHELHLKIHKPVFVLIDEFDTFFAISNSDKGSQSKQVQKAIQIALDGMKSFEGVYFMGLSNIPGAIPIDIYRRVNTHIIQNFTTAERVEIVNQKLTRFPLDTNLTGLLKLLGHDDPTHKDNERLDQYSLFYRATPKLLSEICERTYKLYIEEIANEINEKKMNAVGRKLKKLNEMTTPIKDSQYYNIFLTTGVTITLDLFEKAYNQIFEKATALKEIEVNERFYEEIDGLMNQITGSVFKG